MTALRSLHPLSGKNYRGKKSKSTKYSGSSFRRLSAGFESLEDRHLLSISITPSSLAQPDPVPYVLTANIKAGVQSFALTGPTSGTYAPGNSVTLTWTAANVSSTDVISLCLDKDTTLWNGNEKWIEVDKVSASNGDGSYTFTMPSFASGTYYVAGYMYDKSTYAFINSHLTQAVTVPAQVFTLTGPTSGAYEPGDSVTFTWTASNVSSNDVISLCLDKDTTLWNGNEKWIEVDKVSASNGDGLYTFTIPNVAAGTYYVDGYMYDKVTYAFTYSHVASTITVPIQTFALTDPTSGTYTLGDSVTISWTAGGVGSGSLIRLYYDTDTTLNGNEQVIADNISAANGSGSYAWDTTGMTPGPYYIGGYLRDQGSTYTYSHLTSAFNVQRAGVLISQSDGSTNVTEGGATDSYTVVLTSQPSANVTVNISPDNQVSVDKPSLTFTSSNWSTPQTVTVTAVDDSVVEGNHTGTITHSVSSTDANYNGISVDNVVAQITDNDGVQSFTLTGPAATTMSTSVGMYTTGQTVQINWTAANVLSGSVIHLFYDEDTTPGNGNEHLIADNVSAASGNGYYTWNTMGLHGGIYNIGGYMYDNAGHYTYSYLQLPVTIMETFDVTYSLPTGGTTYYVHQGDNLQTVINNANLGDVIVLDAGATFTGNFTLPNKTSGGSWIYIISSDMASLPAEGTRVGPADAAHMPKIISPNTSPAIATAFGAHNYRFAGIEVSTASQNYNLVLMGFNGQDTATRASSVAQLPSNITFDRCYIHSTSEANWARTGILANGRYVAVVDSYISNFKDSSDAQAICSWFGAGPFKIVNNYLEGTGENVMFGGEDIPITNLVPSDIEFRGNYCFKPLYWKSNDPSYNGYDWKIKNNFELKVASRALIDGNIFENDWTDGQNGTAILFTPRNHGTSSQDTWIYVRDVTFTNNIVRHVESGINILAQDYLSPSQNTQRILIHNNLLEVEGGSGIYSSYATIVDLIITNNLVLFGPASDSKGGSFYDIGQGYPEINNFVFENNIVMRGDYGLHGYAKYEGQASMDSYATPYQFLHNVLIMRTVDISYSYYLQYFSSNYPANNYAADGISSVGFTDFANGDYRLAALSAYHNVGTDGKDPGPDWDVLDNATCNTISGRQ